MIRDLINNATKCIVESVNSDQYEVNIATEITKYYKAKNINIVAERPKVSTSYPDVKLTNLDTGKIAWAEVKMNHTDNLYNKRFQFKNGKWQSMSPHAVGDKICNLLNKDVDAKKWLGDLTTFLKIDIKKLYLPSIAKANNLPKGAVTIEQLGNFLASNPRNITTLYNLNVKSAVIEHYAGGGKTVTTEYLQAGDDFYRFKNNLNSLKFKNVPALESISIQQLDPVFRISLRSLGYELMTTLKFKSITDSPYSFMPGSSKPKPEIGK